MSEECSEESPFENVQLSSGFVTSGANIRIQKSLVDHGDLDNLIGQLMNYVEATYQDKEQRDAHKRLVKRVCREWLQHIYEWQRGWEIAFSVNPKEKKTDSDWTNTYKIS